MKTKEIINEIDWGAVGDTAKKVANIGISTADALMGIEGTKQFDVEKGKAMRNAKALANEFFKIWGASVQRLYNANGLNTTSNQIGIELDDVIEGEFQVDPESYQINAQKNAVISATLKEIRNTKSVYKQNKAIYNSIFQLAIKLFTMNVDERKTISANMYIVNDPRMSISYYFSFQGALTHISEYSQNRNDSDKYHKDSDVDNLTKRRLNDRSDPNVDLKRVKIKDLSGDKQTIKVVGV